MRNSKLNHNNEGFTLEDWLSPKENKKIQKALKKNPGFAHIAIVKNLNLKKDCYYVNGNLVFERDLIK